MNYQASRELSLRTIVDYSGVLSNPAQVAFDRTKHLTGDVLLTYLLHPGTAIYVGITDGFDNVELDPVAGIRTIRNPTTSTGRQFFIKDQLSVQVLSNLRDSETRAQGHVVPSLPRV